MIRVDVILVDNQSVFHHCYDTNIVPNKGDILSIKEGDTTAYYTIERRLINTNQPFAHLNESMRVYVTPYENELNFK